MDNVFRSIINWLVDEKNKDSIFVGGGMFYGWVLSIFTLLRVEGLAIILTWEFVIKTIVGIMIAVITAASVKLGVLLVDNIFNKKIKPKIFKDAEIKSPAKRSD